jgi:hypothetical protein
MRPLEIVAPGRECPLPAPICRGSTAAGPVDPADGLTWQRQPLTDRWLAAPGTWTLDSAVAGTGAIFGGGRQEQRRLLFTEQLP